METPAIPKNEKDRLKALGSYQILDTLSEKDYNDITALASEICDTPISLVTLIDKDRQWFKSSHGIEVSETPRDISFCAHAINTPNRLFEVENTKEDKRFYDNPLVTGETNVGFYAGVPLVNSNGFALGTLCVIDNKPKKLNEKQKEALDILAKQTMNLLELRKRNKEYRATNKKLQTKKEEIEKFAYHAAHDLKSPLNNIEGFIDLLQNGNASSLNDQQIKILEIIKSSAQQLKVLITDLLELSKVDKLTEMKKTEISFKSFILNVVNLLEGSKDCNVNIDAEVDTITANEPALKAVFHNLISNSIKYSDKEKTKISITLKETKENLNFTFKDNGPGIEKKYISEVFEPFKVFSSTDKFGNRGTGLGLTNVKKVITNLGGSITFESEKGKGVAFSFSIRK